MQLIKTINWQEPLEIAASLKDEEQSWLLLYSGMQNDFTGGKSILALKPNKQIKSSDFAELENALTSDKQPFENAWFGYLGYGLKNSLEDLPEDAPFNFDMPDLWMLNFGLILVFDHEKKQIDVWAEDKDFLHKIPSPSTAKKYKATISNLASNMTRSEYEEKVNTIGEAIANGDLYQANLTRKFYGEIDGAHPIDIFCNLCTISPAPYAAFLKLDDKYIISSSPERFVEVDSKGKVDTRPIKGSAPRFDDPIKDAESRKALENSEKDRAENLMIVDLCRNDISRHCVAGSVNTQGLFEVTSYATVHHMASTVTGQKKPDSRTIDLIKGCFPPGSMTGAPKIKAMQLCSELEKVKRGVYSGAIGWFGGDGSADLSVVIRTIIMHKNKFEFQVGGAIVSDSTAQSEFEETITKARAVSAALGVDLEKLRKL